MNTLFKLGLIIVAASLSALCGRSFASFRSGVNLSENIWIEPGPDYGSCMFLASYNYSAVINSNATLEFMVIPFNHLFEPYERYGDYAVASAVIDGWGKLSFKPPRRGIYALVFRTLDSGGAIGSLTMLSTGIFEWDFLWDSLIIATFGMIISLAGLLIEKGLKRRRQS
ncbi:MAG: hypothetical protein QW304_00370 [Thermoproteota archaeon]